MGRPKAEPKFLRDEGLKDDAKKVRNRLDRGFSEVAGVAKELEGPITLVEIRPRPTGEWTYRLYEKGRKEYEGGTLSL